MSDAPTIDDLREHWNTFAPMFASHMEPSTLLLARVLIAHLRLAEAEAILEVGSGAGGAACVLQQEKPRATRLVVTDLSPEMVALARERLPSEVEVREANAQELPFEDASFDRLMANLNLMLVPDPDQALREAARVLKPGGRAAWSVWGRREGSLMFTLPPRAAQAVGFALPEVTRSNFDLGDREATSKRLEAAGFTRVVAWYQPLIRDVASGTTYADLVLSTPRWKGYLESANAPAEQVTALRDELARLAEERLAAGEGIGLETLVLVAERG